MKNLHFIDCPSCHIPYYFQNNNSYIAVTKNDIKALVFVYGGFRFLFLLLEFLFISFDSQFIMAEWLHLSCQIFLNALFTRWKRFVFVPRSIWSNKVKYISYNNLKNKIVKIRGIYINHKHLFLPENFHNIYLLSFNKISDYINQYLHNFSIGFDSSFSRNLLSENL